MKCTMCEKEAAYQFTKPDKELNFCPRCLQDMGESLMKRNDPEMYKLLSGMRENKGWEE